MLQRLALLALHLAAPARAAAPEVSPPAEVLQVGIKETPPFAFRGEGGAWEGVSVALWEDVARELGVEYRYVEHDLPGLLAALEAGEVDVGVAALTVTAEREAVMDFTHPFYTSGLGIAVVPERTNPVVGLVLGVLSTRFLQVVGALSGVLLLVGVLVWAFERRHNPDEFGGGVARGLFSGFWWSAVTMTTVGYGDKSPRTVGGRLVALLWMFASIIMISSFTAAMASALTVERMQLPVDGPEDLPTVVAGTVGASTSELWLLAHDVHARAYPRPAAAVAALTAGEVEAVVYDAPILVHLAGQLEDDAVEVLPRTFERQDYSLAIPEGSPRREAMNRAILRFIGSPGWKRSLNRYLPE